MFVRAADLWWAFVTAKRETFAIFCTQESNGGGKIQGQGIAT
jgi:hypothetical protein